MTRWLEQTAGAQHLLAAVGSLWLIVTSPWIGMRRIVPDQATFVDLAHVAVGLTLAVIASTYFGTNVVGGRWRQHWPWLAGRLRPTVLDLAGLARGRVPSSGGDGLFAVIRGLLLLLFLAAACTGVAWLLADGSRIALAWREWHIVAADAFGWCLLLHALAGLSHFLEFIRD